MPDTVYPSTADGKTVVLRTAMADAADKQTCSDCGEPMQGRPIGFVKLNGEGGGRPWVHESCARNQINKLLDPWQYGTRDEWDEFVKDHEEAEIIMTYAYRRPRNARYRWRLA
jgi:hypothetical protein